MYSRMRMYSALSTRRHLVLWLDPEAERGDQVELQEVRSAEEEREARKRRTANSRAPSM